jgi:hypothetical protein
VGVLGGAILTEASGLVGIRLGVTRIRLSLWTDEGVKQRDVRLPGTVNRRLASGRPVNADALTRVAEDSLDVGDLLLKL